jgi:4-amino-4-deoxy-L-arabinose transferase-like glycosyltransferase
MAKKLFLLFFLALFLRGALLITYAFTSPYSISDSEQSLLFSPDSRTFYETAVNVVHGHGFSQSKTAPYLPEAHFPPVYPSLIALSLFINNSILPLLLLQIFLSSLIPILVWYISGYLTSNSKVRLTASLLMAIEPLSILWSLSILTETVAIFCLLVGVLFFLRTWHDKNAYAPILAGLFLGLSTLTRPHAQLLAVMSTMFLIGCGMHALRHHKNKTLFGIHIRNGLALIIAFTFIVSPWIIRNHATFGTWGVSTTGPRNVFTSFAPAVLSTETGKPFDMVRDPLLQDFADRHHIPISDINENPAYSSELAHEGFAIIAQYPLSAFKVSLIAANAFFTQDLYLYYLQRFGILHRFDIDFSPSVVLFHSGPIDLLNLIRERMGIFMILPVLARIFWISIFLLSCYSVFYIWQKEPQKRIIASVFAVVILYYAATSNVAAFSDHGRFRYPAYAFLFILASYGIFTIQGMIHNRRHIARVGKSD